ncbi:DUF930 domain-containing protein [Agrobacterium sp. CCNWLW71]|uniref:DUF930 domain-containing protein n=1 Tax=unclassified Agrobacterium TaxID=2632611 RepID=UPI002FF08C38
MPVSVLLHLAVVAIFLFELPERIVEPQEPESISVDLVPPPEEKKAEEAPPPGEEKAKEEKPQPPPPPPAPPAEEAKPLPQPQATLPAIAMRPEEMQADREDKPGKAEEAEKTEPSEEPASQPEKPAPPAANRDLQASAAQGEIAVSPIKEESQPDQPPVPQAKPVEEKPAEVAEEKPAKLPAAKSLLSSAVLTPAQRRQIFGDLPPRRRIVQLCQAEALAQIREVYTATRGMYGFSDTGGRISGNLLDATGGAFNVGDVWRDVTFQCEVDVENYAVTAFRFKIGDVITAAEAKKRGFTGR